jgi:hypothetical protein
MAGITVEAITTKNAEFHFSGGDNEELAPNNNTEFGTDGNHDNWHPPLTTMEVQPYPNSRRPPRLPSLQSDLPLSNLPSGITVIFQHHAACCQRYCFVIPLAQIG